MLSVGTDTVVRNKTAQQTATPDSDVQNILLRFGFGSIFEKKSDLVWNEFGSVPFEKHSSV